METDKNRSIELLVQERDSIKYQIKDWQQTLEERVHSLESGRRNLEQLRKNLLDVEEALAKLRNI